MFKTLSLTQDPHLPNPHSWKDVVSKLLSTAAEITAGTTASTVVFALQGSIALTKAAVNLSFRSLLFAPVLLASKAMGAPVPRSLPEDFAIITSYLTQLISNYQALPSDLAGAKEACHRAALSNLPCDDMPGLGEGSAAVRFYYKLLELTAEDEGLKNQVIEAIDSVSQSMPSFLANGAQMFQNFAQTASANISYQDMFNILTGVTQDPTSQPPSDSPSSPGSAQALTPWQIGLIVVACVTIVTAVIKFVTAQLRSKAQVGQQQPQQQDAAVSPIHPIQPDAFELDPSHFRSPQAQIRGNGVAFARSPQGEHDGTNADNLFDSNPHQLDPDSFSAMQNELMKIKGTLINPDDVLEKMFEQFGTQLFVFFNDYSRNETEGRHVNAFTQQELATFKQKLHTLLDQCDEETKRLIQAQGTQGRDSPASLTLVDSDGLPAVEPCQLFEDSPAPSERSSEYRFPVSAPGSANNSRPASPQLTGNYDGDKFHDASEAPWNL